MNPYPTEVLDEEDDDGTMVENVATLAQSVIGHKIVNVDTAKTEDHPCGATTITLDNGKRVTLWPDGEGDVYTVLRGFLLHPERVDHIITGVGTTDSYQTWHIYADMGDVLELSVGWSCGNPFYYGCGFDIQVT